MSQSPEFKQYLISDLEWLVMPPILLRQFRLFYHEGRPVAVVLYALTQDETQVNIRMSRDDNTQNFWRSGGIAKIVASISLVTDIASFEEEALKFALAKQNNQSAAVAEDIPARDG